MGEWQPIETAPKDGTKILVWNGVISLAYWFVDDGRQWPYWSGKKFWATIPQDLRIPSVTHWMALPSPPNTEQS